MTKFDTIEQAQAAVDARRDYDWSFEECTLGSDFVVACYDDIGRFMGYLGEVCA